MTTPDEKTIERVAWAMWREETRESGTPSGVTNGRTPDAFSEQSPELRAKWHKFSRAAIAAMPDTKALEAADRLADAYASLCNMTGKNYHEHEGSCYATYRAARGGKA